MGYWTSSIRNLSFYHFQQCGQLVHQLRMLNNSLKLEICLKRSLVNAPSWAAEQATKLQFCGQLKSGQSENICYNFWKFIFSHLRQFVTRFCLQAISTKCFNGGRTKDLKGMCSTFKIFSSDVMHFNCNLRN